MKELSTEQMAYLSRFEDRMRTATNSNWCSPVSTSELQEITNILNYVTETNRRANANCASCILETLTDIGRIYFAQKEAAKKKVEVKTAKPANIANVAVKTTKVAKNAKK